MVVRAAGPADPPEFYEPPFSLGQFSLEAHFLNACKEGYQPASNFSYGGPLSEMVLLGCLAIRAGAGQKVEWDSANMKCTNVPEVNALVKREYRPGWTI